MRIIKCIFCDKIIEEIDGETFPIGIALIHEHCRGKYERDIENEMLRSMVLK